MKTRETFQAALADTQGYRADGPARRPAFVYSLAPSLKRERHDVAALPAVPTAPLLTGTVAWACQQAFAGAVSAVELTRQALGVIKHHDRALSAFVTVAEESGLLEQARRLDAERKAGHVRGPLHGIPVSVKDVIHVEGMPTSASSRVLAGSAPERRDATAVRLLREAGAIIMGKTHTHEFALGVTTPQSGNPWDASRDPGGSSGGSAISVATGMSLLGLGTDTRASIRVPAALCGIVGYKPTYGLVSTDGIVTLSWSMDHAGLHGRNSRDVALMMNAVQGPDPRDPGSLDLPWKDYTRCLSRDIRGLRIGLVMAGTRRASVPVMRAFSAAAAALRFAGAELVETAIPSEEDIHMATSLGLILSRSEAAAFHSAFSGPRSSGQAPPPYTEAVFEQLDEAAQVKAVDYLNAQRFRAEFAERMLQHLGGFDALMMPTSLVTAPKAEESDQYLMILSENCIPWSFIGFPAMSVPCGSSEIGLPVGAQLVAAPFDDGVLFALASAVEAALPQPAWKV